MSTPEQEAQYRYQWAAWIAENARDLGLQQFRDDQFFWRAGEKIYLAAKRQDDERAKSDAARIAELEAERDAAEKKYEQRNEDAKGNIRLALDRLARIATLEAQLAERGEPVKALLSCDSSGQWLVKIGEVTVGQWSKANSYMVHPEVASRNFANQINAELQGGILAFGCSKEAQNGGGRCFKWCGNDQCCHSLATPAHPASAVVPKWFPIESAPKDGSSVLVMYLHIETQCVFNAFYASEDQGWDEEQVGWWSYEHSEVSRIKLVDWMTPTHWMPLPAAPNPEGQA